MGVAQWIIAGLGLALVALAGTGAAVLNAERRRHEKEARRIMQEGKENARRSADIITEAEKIKNNANTGNHSDDLRTMADQLRNYANGGKQ